MGGNCEDILMELNHAEIIELRKMYLKVDDAFSACTLLDLVLRWNNKQDRVNIIVTSPRGSWQEDGSVVIFLDYRSKSIYVFSLDKTYKNVREGLMKTRRISPSDTIYFLNVSDECVSEILDAITHLNRRIIFKLDAVLYIMDIEDAKSIQITVPPETYLKKLSKEHSEMLNKVWTHRFENSHEFLTVYLEQNGGYGLFKQNDDELIAWVIQGHLGHINLLHTVEEYRGKGFGKVMAQVMAKHIAENGCVPIASVLVDNSSSSRLFERLGFRLANKTSYIFTEYNGENRI